MAMTHTITKTCYVSGDTRTASKSYSADAKSSWQIAVPDASVDLHAVVEIDVSQIVAIYIHSDQAVYISTNDAASASPSDDITLVADVPYIWTTDEYDTNIFDTDITDIYITNASGSAATVTIEVLYDATP
jgi:hypothetical protein